MESARQMMFFVNDFYQKDIIYFFSIYIGKISHYRRRGRNCDTSDCCDWYHNSYRDAILHGYLHRLQTSVRNNFLFY